MNPLNQHADDRLQDQRWVLEMHVGTLPTLRVMDMESALNLSISAGNDVPTVIAQSRLAATAPDRLSHCVVGTTLKRTSLRRRLSRRTNTGKPI